MSSDPQETSYTLKPGEYEPPEEPSPAPALNASSLRTPTNAGSTDGDMSSAEQSLRKGQASTGVFGASWGVSSPHPIHGSSEHQGHDDGGHQEHDNRNSSGTPPPAPQQRSDSAFPLPGTTSNSGSQANLAGSQSRSKRGVAFTVPDGDEDGELIPQRSTSSLPKHAHPWDAEDSGTLVKDPPALAKSSQKSAMPEISVTAGSVNSSPQKQLQKRASFSSTPSQEVVDAITDQPILRGRSGSDLSVKSDSGHFESEATLLRRKSSLAKHDVTIAYALDQLLLAIAHKNKIRESDDLEEYVEDHLLEMVRNHFTVNREHFAFVLKQPNLAQDLLRTSSIAATPSPAPTRENSFPSGDQFGRQTSNTSESFGQQGSSKSLFGSGAQHGSGRRLSAGRSGLVGSGGGSGAKQMIERMKRKSMAPTIGSTSFQDVPEPEVGHGMMISSGGTKSRERLDSFTAFNSPAKSDPLSPLVTPGNMYGSGRKSMFKAFASPMSYGSSGDGTPRLTTPHSTRFSTAGEEDTTAGQGSGVWSRQTSDALQVRQLTSSGQSPLGFVPKNTNFSDSARNSGSGSGNMDPDDDRAALLQKATSMFGSTRGMTRGEKLQTAIKKKKPGNSTTSEGLGDKSMSFKASVSQSVSLRARDGNEVNGSGVYGEFMEEEATAGEENDSGRTSPNTGVGGVILKRESFKKGVGIAPMALSAEDLSVSPAMKQGYALHGDEDGDEQHYELRETLSNHKIYTDLEDFHQMRLSLKDHREYSRFCHTQEQLDNERVAMWTGRWKILYAIISLVAITFNVLTVSIHVGLGTDNAGLSRGFIVFEAVFDLVMFLATIGGGLLEPYEEKGMLITELRNTVSNYFRNPERFVFDFISSFPLLIFFLGSTNGDLIDCGRLNIPLRTWRFHQHFDTFAHLFENSFHPSFWRLVLYVFHFLFIITFLCTILLFLFRLSPAEDTQQWIFHVPLPADLSSDPVLAYTTVWRLALISVADKDLVYPATDAQYIVALIVVMIALVVIVVLIASVEEIIVGIVERSSVVQDKIEHALDSMESLGLSDEIQEEVVTYYSRMWQVCRSFDYNASDDALVELPDILRMDIEYAVNLRMLRSIPLFARVCDNEKFVRAFVGELHHCVILPGAPIVQRGEEGDCMFFLSSGDAAVLGDDDSEVIATLENGAFFGEVSMLFGGLQPNTIVAVTLCVCYVITDDQFDGLIEAEPEALEVILETALDQVRKIEEERRAQEERQEAPRGASIWSSGSVQPEDVDNPLDVHSLKQSPPPSFDFAGENVGPTPADGHLSAPGAADDEEDAEAAVAHLRDAYRRKSVAPGSFADSGNVRRTAMTPSMIQLLATAQHAGAGRSWGNRSGMPPPGGASNTSFNSNVARRKSRFVGYAHNNNNSIFSPQHDSFSNKDAASHLAPEVHHAKLSPSDASGGRHWAPFRIGSPAAQHLEADAADTSFSHSGESPNASFTKTALSQHSGGSSASVNKPVGGDAPPLFTRPSPVDAHSSSMEISSSNMSGSAGESALKREIARHSQSPHSRSPSPQSPKLLGARSPVASSLSPKPRDPTH